MSKRAYSLYLPIIYVFDMDIICVTQRQLCSDFLEQINKIAAAKPRFIILREKDLEERAYTHLAEQVQEICQKHKVPLICNSFYRAAREINAEGIHLPLTIALEKRGAYGSFNYFGISVHSTEEAILAQELGANYITYGHIFATDCKKDLPPRGISALKQVCSAVSIPVYAIGGITPQNATQAINAGAKGICLMSSLMKTGEPQRLSDSFK